MSEPTIRDVIAEMQTMARVAGQASVEDGNPLTAAADGRFADYCAKWADRLLAALAAPPAKVACPNCGMDYALAAEMRAWKDDEGAAPPDSKQEDDTVRYCNCADPENCREPIPGRVCRPRKAAPPDRQEQPRDRWNGVGAEMPQYAVLGIGPEAWVDLESAERYAVDHKHTDRSHVSIRVGTLRLVMKVLRAIRLDDFLAAPVPQGAPDRREQEPTAYAKGRADALRDLASATRRVLTQESVAMLIEALSFDQAAASPAPGTRQEDR